MDEDTIFVGGKPFGVYVKAIMSRIEKDGKALVKTRGKNISSGVSISEFLVREKGVKFGKIEISSGKFKNEKNQERTVPEISIELIQ